MAMAAVQYPQAATLPETHSSSQSIKLSRYNSPSILAGLGNSSSPFFNYQAPRDHNPTDPTQAVRDDPSISVSSLAASAAARNTSEPYHSSKLQKKPSVGSAKSESKQRPAWGASSTHSQSIASYEQSFTGLKQSPSMTVAKDRFKMNLRKLAQQKRDDDQPTLDLSKTLEENEQRSGLGISLRDNMSQPFSPLSPPSTMQAHSRDVSYASQYSASSMSFKPSTPFSFANRPAALPSTPSPEPQSHSTSMIGIDEEYGTSYISGYIGPERSPSSPRPRPRPRINTTESAKSNPRFAPIERSQSTITSNSLSRSTGRPRGNTNQSLDTVSTPKSHTSLDRAFSFIRRGSTQDKPEPMDARTRAASIHAARQAFEEHENAKAKKQERREQKAAEKEQQKQKRTGRDPRKQGFGPRRLGARTRSRSQHAMRRPLEQSQEATGIAYSSMPAGPRPTKGERALTGKHNTGTQQKRSGIKTKYLRFVSWIRTNFLRLGRHRRRSS